MEDKLGEETKFRRKSNDGKAITTLAQTALLRAARSIQPRAGRGDAVPPRDEGGRKPRLGNITGGSAVCGAAAIRQSDLAPGGESRYVGLQIFGNARTGFTLRRADVTQTTRLHIDCRRHTGARDRRQHGDLQRSQCGAVAPTALSGIGAIGVVERAVAEIPDDDNLIP